MTSVTIPNSVISIGHYSFISCSNLSSVKISNGVTSIGSGAFFYCKSLTSIEIPGSVTLIGDSAFNQCSSLTSIEIPNSVTTIGGFAFNGCEALISATIGESVTTIGFCAFSWCSGLTIINSLNPNPPTIDEYTFDGISRETCVLNVPSGSKEAYQSAEYWKDFLNINEKDFSGVEEIEADNLSGDIEVEYYNLQGVRINEPTPGLYIVRRGDKTTKEIVN